MPAVEFKNITKSFGNLVANDDISFCIKRNSIHCILGENGAGKSTLVKILYGACKPDSGKLFINDKEVIFKSPHDAIDNGIGMVWQHFMLIEDFTVLENVILGDEPTKGVQIDFKFSRRMINELLEKFKLNLNCDRKAEDLNISQQQQAEILKVLYRNPSVIILDEPTAVLSPGEINEFFKIVRKFKEDGKTVILITHKLKEVMQIADRVSVLRKGRLVFEADSEEIDVEKLSREIVGDYGYSDTVPDKNEQSEKKIVARFDNVGLIKNGSVKLSGIDLKLVSGEVLGIAGVEGNGQSEIVDLLLNPEQPSSGLLTVSSGKISIVPDDRIKKGMIGEFSIGENSVVRKKGFRFVNEKELVRESGELAEEFDIRVPDVKANLSSLSGGNQQKAIAAREIKLDSDILIFSHPTRGVDLKASGFLLEKIIEQRNLGKAVLLISNELDELIKLSDRICVLYNGKIVRMFSPDELKSYSSNERKLSEEIGKFMIGVSG